jgi:hypothetical protein
MTRRLFVTLALVCALTSPAWAQTRLTAPQLVTLRAHIDGDPALASQPNNSDGNAEIAKAMNLAASPAFTVWKTNVPIVKVGEAFSASELAGLTSLNHTRLQTLAIYLTAGVNPSLPSIRSFFDDIFSGAGGVNTRAALLALWKRLATRAEKLFASGTGSDAVPATMAVEGALTFRDVEAARAL